MRAADVFYQRGLSRASAAPTPTLGRDPTERGVVAVAKVSELFCQPERVGVALRTDEELGVLHLVDLLAPATTAGL